MANEEIKETVAVTESAPAKKTSKKAAVKKEEAKKVNFGKPTAKDYEIIDCPHITEKSMALMQNSNKVTMRVCACANKAAIKIAFQRIFQVKVTDVKVVNQIEKKTTRGGRYQGTIAGFKKAILTIADGEAIDLFKE